MLDAIEVSMIATVVNQIEISPSVLIGSDFGSECKATVHVSAVDDEWAEGDHYSAILHEVKNKTSGEDIMLADNSPLLASNLLVNIYDDDTAGIIIRESNKITSTVELDDDDKDVVGNATYYEDEYFLRLTKEPNGTVEIQVDSIAVATDYDGYFTPDGRNFTARKQVLVNGQEATTVVFDSSNWFDEVEIRVTAINDDIEEGVDYLHFASQPSNLVSSR